MNADSAGQTTRAIVDAGGRALAFRVDVSRPDDIERLVADLVAACVRIDICVNAAGIVKSQGFLEVTEADWDSVIDVNQKGSAFVAQIVGARMIAQVPEAIRAAGKSRECHGKIVNFSSIAGRRGRSFQLHYAASKAAIISITQSAALAFAPYGINVNAISPSVVLTPMWEASKAQKARPLGVDP
jgi:NAD(P)-dependent dehydrogenase (short-subunit alcohol dehydrogenase family)